RAAERTERIGGAHAPLLDTNAVLVSHKLDLDVVLEPVTSAKHDGDRHLAFFRDTHIPTSEVLLSYLLCPTPVRLSIELLPAIHSYFCSARPVSEARS